MWLPSYTIHQTWIPWKPGTSDRWARIPHRSGSPHPRCLRKVVPWSLEPPNSLRPAAKQLQQLDWWCPIFDSTLYWVMKNGTRDVWNICGDVPRACCIRCVAVMKNDRPAPSLRRINQQKPTLSLGKLCPCHLEDVVQESRLGRIEGRYNMLIVKELNCEIPIKHEV